MSETTMELIPVSEQQTGLSVYAGADPVAFCQQTGVALWKGRIGGVSTEGEGYALAMACLCERTHPFALLRKYHVMDGKLSMRADYMLAEFRRRGGKHRWVKDGNDGVEAVLWLRSPDGEEYTQKFTMAEAKQAKYFRSGSAWEKRPGSMLRARCISEGLRMLTPEIVAGLYTAEELEDDRGVVNAEVAPARSPEEIAKRRAELQAASQAEVAADASVAGKYSGPVIDVTAEKPVEVSPAAATGTATTVPTPAPAPVVASTPTPTPVAAAAGVATPPKPDINAVLLEIQSLLPKVGKTLEQLEDGIRKRNPEVKTLNELPLDAAVSLLGKLREMASKATAA